MARKQCTAKRSREMQLSHNDSFNANFNQVCKFVAMRAKGGDLPLNQINQVYPFINASNCHLFGLELSQKLNGPVCRAIADSNTLLDANTIFPHRIKVSEVYKYFKDRGYADTSSYRQFTKLNPDWKLIISSLDTEDICPYLIRLDHPANVQYRPGICKASLSNVEKVELDKFTFKNAHWCASLLNEYSKPLRIVQLTNAILETTHYKTIFQFLSYMTSLCIPVMDIDTRQCSNKQYTRYINRQIEQLYENNQIRKSKPLVFYSLLSHVANGVHVLSKLIEKATPSSTNSSKWGGIIAHLIKRGHTVAKDIAYLHRVYTDTVSKDTYETLSLDIYDHDRVSMLPPIEAIPNINIQLGLVYWLLPYTDTYVMLLYIYYPFALINNLIQRFKYLLLVQEIEKKARTIHTNELCNGAGYCNDFIVRVSKYIRMHANQRRKLSNLLKLYHRCSGHLLSWTSDHHSQLSSILKNSAYLSQFI